MIPPFTNTPRRRRRKGTGSVLRRGNSWSYRWTTERGVRKTVGGFVDEAEARAELTRVTTAARAMRVMGDTRLGTVTNAEVAHLLAVALDGIAELTARLDEISRRLPKH